VATVGIKGDFELYTEKEAFYNCAFLAALANGNSIIHGVKAPPDFFVFADYLRELGATVLIKDEQWEITGINFKCEKHLNLEWVGNDFPHQKRNRTIIENLLNGTPFYCEEKIVVKNSLIRELITLGTELEWKQDGPDENDELAKRIARAQGIKNERKWICRIPPVPSLFARDRFIAGDVTQAAFLALAASLIPDSDIIIKAVCLDSSRAGIFNAFRKLGADIEIIEQHERGNDTWGNLRVKSAKELKGGKKTEPKRFDARALSICLDEIPFLAVLASFAEDETILKLPEWATDFYKPTLSILYENFKSAGIETGLYEDGLRLILRGKSNIEADAFDCKNIPILGLALHVLSKKAKTLEEVKGIECVENLYPGILKVIMHGQNKTESKN
jgi:5-enolpyruvylshikimate-3-phosphate synthase